MRPANASAKPPIRAMALAATRSIVAGLILVVVTGCDNMTWGGVQWKLESSARATEVDPDAASDESVQEPEIPDGPVLFLVQRDPEATGGAGSLIPLAIASGDSLLPILDEDGLPGFPADFTSEHFGDGRAFTLFSEGTRVGTFQSGNEIDSDTSYCLARPRVNGVVELVSEAAGATTFLALRGDEAQAFRHGSFQPMESDYDQRVASLNLAGELFPRFGAQRPLSVLDARRDLQVFAFGGNPEGTIAATFMHQDDLEVGPAPPDAHALFFISENRATGYRADYVWFRSVENGKAAPRFVDFLDWNRDGSAGVVLEIQGADRRWFAAAGKRGDAWRTLFEDPCGQAASTGRAGALD